MARYATGLRWLNIRSVGSILTFIAVGLGGFGWMGVTEKRLAGPVVGVEGIYRAEGWVTGLEDRPDGRMRAVIQLHALSDHSKENQPKFIRVSLFDEPALSIGQAVYFTAKLRPPNAKLERNDGPWARRAFFRQIGAEGFAYGKFKASPLASKPAFGLPISNWRYEISQNIRQKVPGQPGAVIAALMVGDRSGLTQETRENLAKAGLAHILAISGLHMALVGGLAYAFLLFLIALFPPINLRIHPKRYAALFGLLIATVYLMMSGAAISAQRAYVMLFVMLGAVIFNRRAISVHNLGLAAIILLALQPNAIAQPGFHMSFLATFGLIQLYLHWENFSQARGLGVLGWLQRFRNYVTGLAASSLVAGIATAPSALFFFGRASFYGLLGNMLVMPIFAGLLAPLLLLSALFSLFGFQEFPLFLAQQFVSIILGIADWIARLPAPFSNLKPMSLLSYLLLIGAVMLMALAPKRNLYAVAASLIAAIFAWRLAPAPLLWSDGQNLLLRNGTVFEGPKPDFYARRIGERWQVRQNNVHSANTENMGPGQRTGDKFIRCDPDYCFYYDRKTDIQIGLALTPFGVIELCMNSEWLLLSKDLRRQTRSIVQDCQAEQITAGPDDPILIERNWYGKLHLFRPATTSERWR